MTKRVADDVYEMKIGAVARFEVGTIPETAYDIKKDWDDFYDENLPHRKVYADESDVVEVSLSNPGDSELGFGGVPKHPYGTFRALQPGAAQITVEQTFSQEGRSVLLKKTIEIRVVGDTDFDLSFDPAEPMVGEEVRALALRPDGTELPDGGMWSVTYKDLETGEDLSSEGLGTALGSPITGDGRFMAYRLCIAEVSFSHEGVERKASLRFGEGRDFKLSVKPSQVSIAVGESVRLEKRFEWAGPSAVAEPEGWWTAVEDNVIVRSDGTVTGVAPGTVRVRYEVAGLDGANGEGCCRYAEAEVTVKPTVSVYREPATATILPLEKLPASPPDREMPEENKTPTTDPQEPEKPPIPPEPSFVAVERIEGVPGYVLEGNVVELPTEALPSVATNRMIEWRLVQGEMYASLGGNRLTGLVGGTTEGTHPVVVATVKDGLAPGEDFVREFTIPVRYGVSVMPVEGALSDTSVGWEYVQTLTADNGAGAPYSFAVVSGALPEGLSLAPDPLDDSRATISGTPTQEGETVFTIEAKDKDGNSCQARYSLKVEPALAPEPDFVASAYGTHPVAVAAAKGGLAPGEDFVWEFEVPVSYAPIEQPDAESMPPIAGAAREGGSVESKPAPPSQSAPERKTGEGSGGTPCSGPEQESQEADPPAPADSPALPGPRVWTGAAFDAAPGV